MSWGAPELEKQTGSNRFAEELLESENDRRIGHVASKVSTLKQIALDLRSEAKDQVKLVTESGGLFEDAASLMSGSFKRVQGLRRARLTNCKYMCYFALVAAVCLLIAYLLIGRVMAS